MSSHHQKTRLQQFRERLSVGVKGRSASGSVSTGRMMMRVLQVCLLVFILAVVIAWYFLLGPSNREHGSFFNRQANAVWAPHTWSEDPHSVEEIREFVEKMAAGGVKYVFLHVGPIEADGTIPGARYRALPEFLKVARTYGDRVKYLAWMGQIRGKLPLQELQVRREVVRTARVFVEELGMDGIHYDIEPIVDGDTDFLYVLEDTKKALGAGNLSRDKKILSVALPEMIPDYVFAVVRRVLDLKSYLSSEYYLKVAERSDQIAVMTYENSIHSGWIYQYFLKHEVIWLTQLLQDYKGILLIGLPTYDTKTPSFDPKAENIYFGLKGMIEGLNSWRSHVDPFEGVALYGSWTTDAEEWKTMERLFLKRL